MAETSTAIPINCIDVDTKWSSAQLLADRSNSIGRIQSNTAEKRHLTNIHHILLWSNSISWLCCGALCTQNMPPILLLLTVTGWQLMRAEAMSMGWESSEIESNGIDESSNTNSVEDHSSDAEGRINLSMPGKHSTAEIFVSRLDRKKSLLSRLVKRSWQKQKCSFEDRNCSFALWQERNGVGQDRRPPTMTT